jgi:hypothetical protein
MDLAVAMVLLSSYLLVPLFVESIGKIEINNNVIILEVCGLEGVCWSR